MLFHISHLIQLHRSLETLDEINVFLSDDHLHLLGAELLGDERVDEALNILLGEPTSLLDDVGISLRLFLALGIVLLLLVLFALLVLSFLAGRVFLGFSISVLLRLLVVGFLGLGVLFG